MAVTRKGEEDSLWLACPLTLKSLVDCDANRVIGFRRGNDSLAACEGESCLKGGALRDRDRLDQAFMVELRNKWRVAVVAKAAGMDRGRHEVAPQRVHEHQGRETFGVAGVVCVVSARQGGTRLGLHRDQPNLASRCLIGKKWKRRAAKVRTSAAACDDHIRVVTNLLELLLCLEPDHRLMKQHMVENRPERIVGIGTRCRLFNCLRDGDSKRAR